MSKKRNKNLRNPNPRDDDSYFYPPKYGYDDNRGRRRASYDGSRYDDMPMKTTPVRTSEVKDKMEGTVKWFNDQKGYGFITASDGKDYFVHFSGINMKGRKTLENNQKVTFILEDGKNGPQAVNVTVVGE